MLYYYSTPTSTKYDMSTTSKDQGGCCALRALALDGGGVRGLVSLLMLRRLMFLINPGHPPKPCDVFDVIAGTSTGGLLAIMLGRLEMDIDTAIAKYVELSKVIFTPRKRNVLGGHLLHNLMGNATFDGKVLETCIKEVVKGTLGTENMDAPLLQEKPKCKIFVCASLSNGGGHRLRNYPSQFEEPIACTIWEAARATTAAPSFFDPITFTNGMVFRDGALRNNNPIFELVHEIQSEFADRDISTIVSLGSGVSASIHLGKGLVSVGKACVKIATDTESTADRFVETYCAAGAGPYREKYFRFNVTQGLQHVGLQEWQKHDLMSANTLSYLAKTEQREKLGNCANRLKMSSIEPTVLRQAPSSPIKSPNYDEALARSLAVVETSPPTDDGNPSLPRPLSLTARGKTSNPNEDAQPFYQLDRIGKFPVRYFADMEEVQEIEDLFSASPENGLRAVAIGVLGLGGAGKTQLILQYASLRREEYGVVLWLDARTEETLLASIELAVCQLGLVLPKTAQLDPNASLSLSKYCSKGASFVELLRNELCRRKQSWLLLFDGVDDSLMLSILPTFIPSAPGGRVLISSRQNDAYRLVDHSLMISGLSPASARDLLFHHAGIKDPSVLQTSEADEVIKCLEYIPLAIDLAGTYIRTLGSLKSYVALYKSHEREELLMRSIGSIYPKISGYKMSVFAAWRVSIHRRRPETARFFYLLCFLDATNLSIDLFRRACSSKHYWNEEGNQAVLHPRMNYVPEWLLELFCSKEGRWNEFAFQETLSELSSCFFLSREEIDGVWLHESGPVKSKDLTSSGDSVILLRLPQPLYDLGKFYPSISERQAFSFDAFGVAMHAFQNDIKRDLALEHVDAPIMLVGQGGAIGQPSKMSRQLEETFYHILALKDYILDTDYSGNSSFADIAVSTSRRCEVIILGYLYSQLATTSVSTEEISGSGGDNSDSESDEWESDNDTAAYDNRPSWKSAHEIWADQTEENKVNSKLDSRRWQRIVKIADILLTNRSQSGYFGDGGFQSKRAKVEGVRTFKKHRTGSEDSQPGQGEGLCAYERQWVKRNASYHKKISSSSQVLPLGCAIYQLAAIAEAEWEESHHLKTVLERLEIWVAKQSLTYQITSPLKKWVKSDMFEVFLSRAKARSQSLDIDHYLSKLQKTEDELQKTHKDHTRLQHVNIKSHPIEIPETSKFRMPR